MKKVSHSRRNRRDSRGSALLVSLMVIVGLSLLGLGFVAISETESAIAKNEQNALQTEAIAEAGSRMIVEWFQDPTWGETKAAMPLNSDAAVTSATIPTAGAIKTLRSTSDGYSGVYKPLASQKLCDKPFRPDQQHRFYGDEDHADIIINNTTLPAYITKFNDKLLASNGTTATDLDKLAGEPLPEKAAMSLVNANIAIPINAAIAANVLSDNAIAAAQAAQSAPIDQST